MRLGTLLIAIVFLLFNCSDENEDKLSPTTEYYFIGKVDNHQILIEEKDDIEFIGGFSDYGSNGEGCYGSYKTGLYKISESGGQTLTLQMNFYNVAHAEPPCDESDLNEAFFSELIAGDYHLSWIKNDMTTVGIHYYDDKKQKFWSSIEKEQPDDKSFFTVEKTEFLGIDDSGKKLQKVEGKFSSYLYEYDFETESVIDSIFISDAKFVFRFISE